MRARPEGAEHEESEPLAARHRLPEEGDDEARPKEGSGAGVEHGGEGRVGPRDDPGHELESREGERGGKREERAEVRDLAPRADDDEHPGGAGRHRDPSVRIDPLAEEWRREQGDEEGGHEVEHGRLRDRQPDEAGEEEADGDDEETCAGELKDGPSRPDEASERNRSARRPPRRVERDVHEDGRRVPPHDLDRVQIVGQILRRGVDDGNEGDRRALESDRPESRIPHGAPRQMVPRRAGARTPNPNRAASGFGGTGPRWCGRAGRRAGSPESGTLISGRSRASPSRRPAPQRPVVRRHRHVLSDRNRNRSYPESLAGSSGRGATAPYGRRPPPA